MEDRSPYSPELFEVPKIGDTTTGTLRTFTALDRRLPAMPSGELRNRDLSFTNGRAIEAEELMNDMRAAFSISRGYDKRNKAVAKARARRNDRSLKNSSSAGNRNRRKMQGRTQRMIDSTVLRNARDVLGMGTDLYR